MGERRSAYLILGVPFGVSKDEATRAFARASRRLRQLKDAPYDAEDLNWALHEIEQRIADPASSIDDFRVPADSSVYELPGGNGSFDPPESLYRRRTPPTEPDVMERLGAEVVLDVAWEIADTYRTTPLPTLHLFPEKGPQ